MKKSNLVFVIYIIGIILATISCDNQNRGVKKDILKQYDIVKIKAESFIKTKLNDLNSYEFVELKLIDSVLFKDNIEYRKRSFIESRDVTYPLIYKDVELNNKIRECNKILEGIDSIELALGDNVNKVASYTYLFSLRSLNSNGTKVLDKYTLQTDAAPSFSVIHMTDNENKVLINPNDFPGYNELIAKLKKD